MATTASPPPVLSPSGAPVAFKGARSSPTAADRSKRRDSDHSFTSRGPVVEVDDDDDGGDAPRSRDASGKRRDASSPGEAAQTSQSPLSIPPSHAHGQSDLSSTVRAPFGGERQGSMPVPAPGAPNQSDLRGPLPAFRIRGQPEFNEGPIRMPEVAPTLSHRLPGGLVHTDSGSSRDSRATEGTDDDERMWEENQALYRAIQSRLGIEGSTPSDQSSSAHTPVLPIPGGFPATFRFGGAESSDNEGEEDSAHREDVRAPHSFPQPAWHAGSSSGTSLPPGMPNPARAPLVERPSTDTFFTTNSDSVYLTPHQHEGGGGGGAAAESDASDEEDYTRKLSSISIPDVPSTPPPPFLAPIPEPTTPKAVVGMPQPKNRPSMPEPSNAPHGRVASASMPEPHPKVSIPEPTKPPELVPPQSRPSIPIPVLSTPAMPKPESKPTVFSVPPRPQHTLPSQPQHTLPSQPQPPASTATSAKPTIPSLGAPSPATSQQSQTATPTHAFGSTKPPSSPPILGSSGNTSQVTQQKPPLARPQHQQYPASHATVPLQAASTLQAKPPSKPEQTVQNSASLVGGGKPSSSGLAAAPSKPTLSASSPSPHGGNLNTLGGTSTTSHDPLKPAKPTGSMLSPHNNGGGGNMIHTSSSTSLSTAKPPPKPASSISELKPSKISPSHSTSGSQGKHDGAGPTSSSGKPSSIKPPSGSKPPNDNSNKTGNSNNNNTRYVNMLLALDDIPNYWNLLASFFTWILLAGFLLFPGTFTSWREEQAQQVAGGGGVSEQVKGAVLDVVSHVPLYVIAWVCSAVGVAGMTWLWWRWMANYIWLLNKVFVPGLLNALAGLVSTLANIFGAQNGQLSTAALTTLIVTASSTGVLLLMVLFYQFWLLRRVQNEHWRAVGKQKAGRHGEGVLKGMVGTRRDVVGGA